MKRKIVIFVLIIVNIGIVLNLNAQNQQSSTKIIRSIKKFQDISGIIFTCDKPVTDEGQRFVPLLVKTNSDKRDLTFKQNNYPIESHFDAESKQYHLWVLPLAQNLMIRRGEWDTIIQITEDMFANKLMAPVFQAVEDDAGSFMVYYSNNFKSATFFFEGKSIEPMRPIYCKPGEYGFAIDMNSNSNNSMLKKYANSITIKPFFDRVLFPDSIIGFLSVVHNPKSDLRSDSIKFDLSIDDIDIGKAPKEKIALWKDTKYIVKIYNNSPIPCYNQTLLLNNSKPFTLFVDKPVVIKSNVENAIIKINGKIYGKTSNSCSDKNYLMPPIFLYAGSKNYEITAEEKDHFTASQMLQISIDNKSDPIEVNLFLKADCTKKVKRLRNIKNSLIISATTLLCASAVVGYLDYTNFNKYKKSASTVEASKLHKTIVTQDRLFWVSLGLGIADFIPSLYYNHKYRSYKRKNCQ